MPGVPAGLLRCLSGLLAGERRRRVAPAGGRMLACREQATLALRWFRGRTRAGAARPRPWGVPRDRLPARLRAGVSARS